MSQDFGYWKKAVLERQHLLFESLQQLLFVVEEDRQSLKACAPLPPPTRDGAQPTTATLRTIGVQTTATQPHRSPADTASPPPPPPRATEPHPPPPHTAGGTQPGPSPVEETPHSAAVAEGLSAPLPAAQPGRANSGTLRVDVDDTGLTSGGGSCAKGVPAAPQSPGTQQQEVAGGAAPGASGAGGAFDRSTTPEGVIGIRRGAGSVGLNSSVIRSCIATPRRLEEQLAASQRGDSVIRIDVDRVERLIVIDRLRKLEWDSKVQFVGSMVDFTEECGQAESDSAAAAGQRGGDWRKPAQYLVITETTLYQVSSDFGKDVCAASASADRDSSAAGSAAWCTGASADDILFEIGMECLVSVEFFIAPEFIFITTEDGFTQLYYLHGDTKSTSLLRLKDVVSELFSSTLPILASEEMSPYLCRGPVARFISHSQDDKRQKREERVQRERAFSQATSHAGGDDAASAVSAATTFVVDFDRHVHLADDLDIAYAEVTDVADVADVPDSEDDEGGHPTAPPGNPPAPTPCGPPSGGPGNPPQRGGDDRDSSTTSDHLPQHSLRDAACPPWAGPPAPPRGADGSDEGSSCGAAPSPAGSDAGSSGGGAPRHASPDLGGFAEAPTRKATKIQMKGGPKEDAEGEVEERQRGGLPPPTSHFLNHQDSIISAKQLRQQQQQLGEEREWEGSTPQPAVHRALFSNMLSEVESIEETDGEDEEEEEAGEHRSGKQQQGQADVGVGAPSGVVPHLLLLPHHPQPRTSSSLQSQSSGGEQHQGRCSSAGLRRVRGVPSPSPSGSSAQCSPGSAGLHTPGGGQLGVFNRVVSRGSPDSASAVSERVAEMHAMSDTAKLLEITNQLIAENCRSDGSQSSADFGDGGGRAGGAPSLMHPTPRLGQLGQSDEEEEDEEVEVEEDDRGHRISEALSEDASDPGVRGAGRAVPAAAAVQEGRKKMSPQRQGGGGVPGGGGGEGSRKQQQQQQRDGGGAGSREAPVPPLAARKIASVKEMFRLKFGRDRKKG